MFNHVLDAAIGVLTQKTWIQGCNARDDEGNSVCGDKMEKASCFCLVGAIMVSCDPSDEDFLSDLEGTCDQIMDKHPEMQDGDVPMLTLAKWNDEVGRTKEEVIHLLETSKL